MYPDTQFVFYDDIEDALIGVVTRFGQEPILCYDYYRCLAIYQERDGISHEEAVEHFEFNVIGGYVGPKTPCFLQKDGLNFDLVLKDWVERIDFLYDNIEYVEDIYLNLKFVENFVKERYLFSLNHFIQQLEEINR